MRSAAHRGPRSRPGRRFPRRRRDRSRPGRRFWQRSRPASRRRHRSSFRGLVRRLRRLLLLGFLAAPKNHGVVSFSCDPVPPPGAVRRLSAWPPATLRPPAQSAPWPAIRPVRRNRRWSRSRPRRGPSRRAPRREEPRVLHALNDHLCNSIAAAELDRLVPVRIEQCHRDFSAVAGVHRAGSVHHRQSVLGGEAGPRVDQRNEAVRERNRDAGRNEAALPRCEDDVLAGAQVRAGVARVRVRRRLEPVVEHFQLYRQGGRSVGCVAGRQVRHWRRRCFLQSQSLTLTPARNIVLAAAGLPAHAARGSAGSMQDAGAGAAADAEVK